VRHEDHVPNVQANGSAPPAGILPTDDGIPVGPESGVDLDRGALGQGADPTSDPGSGATRPDVPGEPAMAGTDVVVAEGYDEPAMAETELVEVEGYEEPEVEVVSDADPDAETDADAGFEGDIDIDVALLDSIEQELADVERALARLDDGTYGLCEVCGNAIGDAELTRVPTNRFCPDHLPLSLA
jgi:RNA polymerase-binding transcription factor DksA